MAIRYLSGINVDTNTLFVDAANDRVGIGTASPSRLLQLNSSGQTDLHLTSTNQGVGASDGMTIFLDASGTGGLWLREAAALRFATSSSERMRIDASGNVGIGTTAPSRELEVTGAGNVYVKISTNSNTDFPALELSNAFAGKETWTIANLDTDNSLRIYNTGGYKAVITSGGNVGIGTTSPSNLLSVGVANNTTSKGITIENTSGTVFGRFGVINPGINNDTYIGSISNNNFSFYTSNSEKMRITYNGNVGIGTTAPISALHILGNQFRIEDNDPTITLKRNVASAFGGHIDWLTNDNTLGFQIANNALVSAAVLEFNHSGVNRMVIKSDGNVGIGTTSPISSLNITTTKTVALDTAAKFLTLGLTVDDLTAGNTAGGGGGIAFRSKNTNAGTQIVFGAIDAIKESANVSDFRGSLRFFTNQNSTGIPLERMRISSAGAIQFNSYDSTNNTGTPTYLLGTDASGNIVKTNTVPGSAAGPYLPLAGGTLTGDVLAPRYDIGTSSTSVIQETNRMKFTNSIANDAGGFDFYTRKTDSTYINALQILGTGNATFAGNVTVTGNIAGDASNTTEVGTYSTGAIKRIRMVQGGELHFGDTTTAAPLGITEGDWNSFSDADRMSIYGRSSIKFYAGGVNPALRLTLDTNATFVGRLTTTDDITIDNSSPELYFKTGATHYSWMVAAQENVNQTFEITPSTVVGGTTFSTPALKINGSDSSSIFTGTVTSPTFLGDLNGTINTVTTAVTKANATNDTTVATTAFVQNLIGTIPAGLVFQGTWNAATNTPTLTSGTGTTGYFYIVSVAGTTSLDGITDWQVGDWAVFVEQGATDAWEKVDNSSVLDGAGTGQTVALWSGSGTSNTLTDAPITVSGNDTTFAGSIFINGFTNPNTQYLSLRDSFVPSASGGIGLMAKDHSGSSNDGLALYGHDGIGMFTAQTERMRISSAGLVTISNTGTAHLLLNGDTNNLGDIGEEDSIIDFRGDGGAYGYRINTENWSGQTALNFQEYINGSYTSRLFISKAGNVGIGTTAPLNLLHVSQASANTIFRLGNNASYDQFIYFNGGNDWSLGMDYSNSNAFVLSNASSIGTNDRVVVTTAGNVGIGTTSPSEKLEIIGGGASDAVEIRLGTNTSSYRVTSIGQNDGNGAFEFGSYLDTYIVNRWTTNDNGDLILGTNNQEQMRISHSGNVGIGTTNPGDKLNVEGNILLGTTDKIGWRYSSGNTSYNFITGEDQILTLSGGTWTSSGTQTAVRIKTQQGEKLTIRNNGDVGIGTTSPTNKLHVEGRIEGDNFVLGGSDSTVFYGLYRAGVESREVRLVSYAATPSSKVQLGFNDISGSTYTFAPALTAMYNGNVGIGTTAPSSKLQVAGGIQMADDTDTAVAAKVGTMRYRTGTEYVEVDGVELVTNGDFATNTDWSGSYSITSGQLTKTTGGLAYQESVVSSAKYYRVVVDVVSLAAATNIYAGGTNSSALAVGINSFIIQAGSTNTWIGFNNGYTGTTGSVFNSISVVEVTAEDASYADMCMQTGASTYEWVNIVRNTY